jgi:beta-lactamase superfamily II metal-dependent hydrolase
MANRLTVTFIDVGTGDSILIESENSKGQILYALVDCNDTADEQSSLLFLKRLLQRRNVLFTRPVRIFRFVLVTHTHADHCSGISRILRTFGCDYLLYSGSSNRNDPQLAQIFRYRRRRGTRLGAIQPVRRGLNLSHVPFGAVRLAALWPSQNFRGTENDHSVVLTLTLKKVTFVLTGDVSAARALAFARMLNRRIRVFQVPHHGAINGTFDNGGNTPWVTHFSKMGAPDYLAISCHRIPYGHPDIAVLNAFTASVPTASIRRTDQHYHLVFETNGTNVRSYYTH